MDRSNNKRVLIFIDWFYPAYKAGGPIKSVTNIINSLHNEFCFDVVTSDRDIGDVGAFPNIELNHWIDAGRYRIIYLDSDNRMEKIKSIIENAVYDYAYFNSAFSKDFTILPIRMLNKIGGSIKLVLAPRGMFGKGALAIKPFKKSIFLYFAKWTKLYKNVLWHATNEFEKSNIVDVFDNKIRCQIAGNISSTKVHKESLVKEIKSLRLVFFSRISTKKNLSYILELLNALSLEGIQLDIYGPIEDEAYWQDCCKQIERLKLPINYMGAIEPSAVQFILSKYHFFILPTFHENFGHVIVEAMVSGCGLIISDQTPWTQLETKGIGWDISLANKEKWISVLSDCFNMSQSKFNNVRKEVYDFAIRVTDDRIEIEETKKLFM